VLTPSERSKLYRQRNKDRVSEYERKRRVGGQRAEYKREWNSRHKPFKSFVGVDGEGRDTADGRHAYFMLRAGTETLNPRDGEERLRTTDCLEFLSSLSPDSIYVAYFFDYDVTKILEDVPFAKLSRLIHREKRLRHNGGYFPIDFQGYQFDWFPRKEFKVRKELKPAVRDGMRWEKAEYSPWITINDTGTFFQTSFIKTLDTWGIGNQNERESIAEGKLLRGEFEHITDEYIDEYNWLECKLLAELMEDFRDVCEDVGYIPRKWQGPGVLAEAAMERHNVPQTSDIPLLQDSAEDSVASFGRYAYYGPKFETSCVGPTEAPCVQFDINSAFPAAMLHLPCLLHGTWKRETGKRQLVPGEVSLCFGAFRWQPGSKRAMFMGFPVRREDGSIHFPFNGKGWYWSFEAEAARHQEFTVYDSWTYERNCDCQPFAFLKDIYDERKRIGKGGRGIVLKLVINSMYGKLVQTVGNPHYSNPIWASFITAWTRTQIADAIHSLPCCKSENPQTPCGYDVYMIASDAIYTRKYAEYDIKCSDKLGDWDRVDHPNGLFLVQPGVYFDPSGEDDGSAYKTRGIPRRVVVEHHSEFIAGFGRILETHRIETGDVYLPFHTFVGIRQSIARRNMRQLGQFVEYSDSETGRKGRRTSFEWTTKRRPQPLPQLPGDGATRGLRTLPYWGTVDEKTGSAPVQTIPYSKDIGGLKKRALERLAFEDQPDWIRTE
jgi:hypothetical protein